MDLLNILTNSLSGLWPKPDENPHLVNGKLRPCPGTPNCVSSESDDMIHRIDPFAFNGSTEQAWDFLKKVISENGGTVHDEQPEYIWSTFIVPVFGFIDDVEFRLCPKECVIHVRSASRLGFSDLGVNRARVEQLRTSFTNVMKL
ncbi:MAG: DUF1499 domain-containing protein [Chlorobiaceae bacterium]